MQVVHFRAERNISKVREVRYRTRTEGTNKGCIIKPATAVGNFTNQKKTYASRVMKLGYLYISSYYSLADGCSQGTLIPWYIHMEANEALAVIKSPQE